MPNPYTRILFFNRLTIYYRTETGKMQPSTTNKAWIIFYFKGEIYAEDGDITAKEFNQIQEISRTNVNTTRYQKDQNTIAARLTMQKLNNEGRWYVFKDIRELGTLKRIISKYFYKGAVVDECQGVRKSLIAIEKELEKEERDKWKAKKN